VPSLTETLIECGINVVGRTRFCVHPADAVESVTKVGGTKAVNWDKVKSLGADLVIFDREENLKEMADSCPLPWHATHITSVDSVAPELQKLAQRLNSSALSKLSLEWATLAAQPPVKKIDFERIPGLIETLANKPGDYSRIEYIIWRDPWMAVGPQTFIGSMLARLGFANYLHHHDKAYPKLDNEQMADPNVFYLFSSEPFPFANQRQQLLDEGFNGAIVDGEVYSWFGIRSYRALKVYLNLDAN
jgi:ABC-type Fe3+-hydroxamate transport system substrate-binding protein